LVFDKVKTMKKKIINKILTKERKESIKDWGTIIIALIIVAVQLLFWIAFFAMIFLLAPSNYGP